MLKKRRLRTTVLVLIFMQKSSFRFSILPFNRILPSQDTLEAGELEETKSREQTQLVRFGQRYADSSLVCRRQSVQEVTSKSGNDL